MRRPFVNMICALAVALLPATLVAQDPPPTQPPAQPAAPKPPRIAFKTDAGLLLITIKAGEEAAFEELVARTKDALSKSEDPIRKQQAAGLKVYKAAEPAPAGNVLYVLVTDPAVKAAEYDPIMLMVEALGKEYSTPENQAKMKSYAGTFVNVNQLNLTPVVK